MQAQIFINTALSLIGRLGVGRTAGPSESAVCLQVLNDMLLSWSTDKYQIYNVGVANYPLITTQQSYSIGPSGANFTAARPVKVETAGILSTNASGDLIRTELEILVQAQWQAIKNKFAKASLPTQVYYDFAFPNANLLFFPIPVFTSTAPQLELGTWTPLVTFATLTTDNSYPDGYERAITYNLAIELHALYQMGQNKVGPLAQNVIAIAKESRDIIRAMNNSVFPDAMPPQQQNQPGAGRQ